jgi:hypothetical protein
MASVLKEVVIDARPDDVVAAAGTSAPRRRNYDDGRIRPPWRTVARDRPACRLFQSAVSRQAAACLSVSWQAAQPGRLCRFGIRSGRTPLIVRSLGCRR